MTTDLLNPNLDMTNDNSRGAEHVSGPANFRKMLLALSLAVLISLGMGSTVSASTVALEWDPSPDATVAGYRVHYQADSSAQPFQGYAPVDVQGAYSTEVSNLDPSREYSFAVTAYNAEGIESAYSNIVTIPEQLAPTTTITYPANTAAVNGIVNVTADAADNVGVARVEFFVNGVLQASSATIPHVFPWDTSALASGDYALLTRAYDPAGNRGQSQIVMVKITGDQTAPTVTLTSPENNGTVSGTITLSADAADNVAVTRVDFYRDDLLLSASDIVPFSHNWDTTGIEDGSHLLTARAYDAAGNVGQSQSVAVKVVNYTSSPGKSSSSRKTK